MLKLNLENFITVGLISMLFIAIMRYGFKMAGANAPV